MTTDLKDPAPAAAEEDTRQDAKDSPELQPASTAVTHDRDGELESFLEIAKHKINANGETPCAACGILVHIDLNVCPHCESFIAANNALMRESARRLAEIQGDLDGEHARYAKDRLHTETGPTFGEKIKRFFSGGSEDDAPSRTVADPSAPRLLRNSAEGDQLKILEYDGPWFKVKTRDGQTGWVYSTLRIDD